ncbi:response regulator transcription factor [Niastella caeni]|uniref:Response regulator transcription factor n=1 Tax=Niastella caeni TaxID=2569763 RepID=A0A4S8HID9_9BACT|nr:LytTR family DNA-binding domain-containing protein [Niastella caeni]THU34887.1 response regulator transcription factor [Niastella caeni]
MMKAIIIDDEANCLTSLQNDLETYCPHVTVIATCRSAREALTIIEKQPPDLIFLDVKMPGMSGFEMLEMIGQLNFQIIFTTAHDEFAVRAFRVSAVDYLLKPIPSEELVSAVNKAAGLMQGKKNDHKAIANLLHNAGLPHEQQRIAIPNRSGYDFIYINDILYCKAEGAYTNIVLKDKKLLLSRSLGETVQMLPVALFERAHHSLLVNIQHITSYSKADGYIIVMTNGDQLNVSRTRREQLLIRLGVR